MSEDNKLDQIREEVLTELSKVAKHTRRGMMISKYLLILSFSIGVVLIIFSCVILFRDDIADLYKIIFSGAGLLNTFGALIFYPIEKLQLSNGRSAVYQAVFAGWLSDTIIYERFITDKNNQENKKDNLTTDDYLKLRESYVNSLTVMMTLINPKSDISNLSSILSRGKDDNLQKETEA